MHTLIKDYPQVISKPPYLFFIFLVLGSILQLLLPLDAVPRVAQTVLGPVLLLDALVLLALAMGQFRSAGTPVETWKPTRTIVDTGVYRFSRNPIYLGMFIGFIGFALLTLNAWSLLLVLPLYFVIRFGVVEKEEGYLEQKFGEQYRRYKSRVRRWL